MQTGTARLRLNKVGSDVPVVGITPAEALLLHVLHQGNNGGSTYGDKMDSIEVTGEATVVTGYTEPVAAVEGRPAIPAKNENTPQYVPPVPEVKAVPAQPAKPITRPRTDAEEYKRLNAKYGRIVNKKGDKILKAIWPELSPKLPQKFSELDWKEIQFDGETADINLATGQPILK